MEIDNFLEIYARDLIQPDQFKLIKNSTRKILYDEKLVDLSQVLSAGVLCWVALKIVLGSFIWLFGIQSKFTHKLINYMQSFAVCRFIEYLAYESGDIPLNRIGNEMKSTTSSINQVSEKSVIYFQTSFNLFQILSYFFQRNTKQNAATMFLNLVSLSSLFCCLYCETGTPEAITLIWIIEFTNQFLRFGNLLKDAKMRKTKLAILNKIFYLLTFVLLRLGLFSYLLYQIIEVSRINLYCKGVITFSYLSGIFFCLQLMSVYFKN